MKDKYLPIGSIVTINDTNKSVMIVGYYAIKYQNVVKMYDYIGISYPEGTLLGNTFAFNHSDITNVLFEGFIDESFGILNNNMLGQNNQDTKDYKKDDNFVNVKYDANGVVAYDEFTDSKSVSHLVELLDSMEVKNPFETPVSNSAPSAIPVIEQNNAAVLTDDLALKDKENIENNLNNVLENNQDAKTDEIKIDIPSYKFTEDGIIFNE